jgi:surface antigen
MKILAAGLIALSAGACSFSFGVVGIHDEGPQATGSIAPKTAAASMSPDLSEEDWRRAKAALAVALDPQGPGTLVSWDNPTSSMKGSFAPNGAPFVKNDEICRSFSAQLAGSSPSTHQGVACRPSGGDWAIKEIKPAAKGTAKV